MHSQICTRNLDLWPLTLKTFPATPLSWWIFMESFIKISPVSKEILRHARQVSTDGRTDSRTPTDTCFRWHNITLLTGEIWMKTVSAYRQWSRFLLGRPTLVGKALSFTHEHSVFFLFLSIYRAQQPRIGWPSNVFRRSGRRWSFNNGIQISPTIP